MVNIFNVFQRAIKYDSSVPNKGACVLWCTFISPSKIIIGVNLLNTAPIHYNFRRCYSYLADLALPTLHIKIWGCLSQTACYT